MKLLLQVTLLFGICLIGELISSLIPLPIPSSIISMILLFILLLTNLIKVKHTDSICDFLLQNMALFFIPSGVAIINYFGFLQNYLVQFVFICIITTIITFISTAYTIIGIRELQKRLRKDKNNV